jgi:hypothetical protein
MRLMPEWLASNGRDVEPEALARALGLPTSEDCDRGNRNRDENVRAGDTQLATD